MNYEGKQIDQDGIAFAKSKAWMDDCDCPVAGYFYVCYKNGHGETLESTSSNFIQTIRFVPSQDEKQALGIQDWNEVYLYEKAKGGFSVKSYLE